MKKEEGQQRWDSARNRGVTLTPRATAAVNLALAVYAA